MKKRRWIILICVIILAAICTVLWSSYKLINNPNPIEEKKTCNIIKWWECPEWFLEEKWLETNFVRNLPEWWEEAWCVEKEEMKCIPLN